MEVIGDAPDAVLELSLATAIITASSVDKIPNGFAVERRNVCIVAAAAKMSDMKSRNARSSPSAASALIPTERASTPNPPPSFFALHLG